MAAAGKASYCRKVLSSCRHLYQLMIQYAMHEDPGIEALIDLHGEIVDQDEGYWVKIEAWRVDRVLKEVKQK